MEEAEAIIATGALVEKEIYGVFVEPAVQGKGHGKTIMHEPETRAREKGCSEVTLRVSLPSRNFYQYLGYKITEAARIDLREGQQLDFWKAKKSLGISPGRHAEPPP